CGVVGRGMQTVGRPRQNGPVTADLPPGRWRRVLARVLRRSGPQPRLTRRNWVFDVLLVAVFAVAALSGTDITDHLFDTTNDAVTAVQVPDLPDLPDLPHVPDVGGDPDGRLPPTPVDPFDHYRNAGYDSQGPGWIAIAVLLPIGLAVNGMRTWRQRADRLRAERADALGEATRRERARIARELHDIVTHNVSMMVIQAGAARKVLDNTPEAARDALLAVEEG